MKITNRFNLNYRLWQGWGWATNILWGLVIAIMLAAAAAAILAANPLYQLANYLATNPLYYGLPFYARLGVLGGGVIILSALVLAIVLVIKHYTNSKITNEDLDIMLGAVYKKLDDLSHREY
jgi:hypothetical protein